MSARHARRAFRPVVPLLVMIALIMMQKPCQGQTALFPSPIVPFDISADVPLPDASTQQGQSSSRPTPSPTPNPNATIENTSAAGDSPDEPRRKLVKWNETRARTLRSEPEEVSWWRPVGSNRTLKAKSSSSSNPTTGFVIFVFFSAGNFQVSKGPLPGARESCMTARRTHG